MRPGLSDNRSESPWLVRHWSWLVLAGILAFAAGVRIHALDAPLERDEGEYAYAGQLILEGAWPYKAPSLYKYKLPGTYFLYAVILACFGQTPAGVHTGLLVANLLTIITLFALTKKFFGQLAALAAAAFYCYLSMTKAVLGFFAHGEHFVMLSALAGILLLVKSLDSWRWATAIMAGVLIGSGYVIRQHGAFFVLFAPAYMLVHYIARRDSNWKVVLLRCAALCISMAIPFALTCALLAAVGVFDRFWYWTFDYARTALTFMTPEESAQIFGVWFVAFVAESPVIFGLSIVGTVLLIRRRDLYPRSAFAFMFFAFSFVSVCPGGIFREHYFVQVMPAVAILAGAGLTGIGEIMASRRLRRLSIAVPAVVAIATMVQAFYQNRGYLFAPPVEICRQTYYANPFPESLEIAKYIRDNTEPNELVAILGSEPQILFYAHRRSATGYTDTYEMVKPHPRAEAMQKEMIAEIEAAKPKFVIFFAVSSSWLEGPASKNLVMKWFNEECSKTHRLVGMVDLRWPEPTAWAWGDSAAAAIPKSGASILIVKRI